MIKRFRASWILSGDRQPLRDGVLAVENGKILQLESYQGETIDRDYCGSLIVPGFVNAHTHLDLSENHQGITVPGNFPAWLQDVVNYRRTSTQRERQTAIQEAVSLCILHGTTLVGDISSRGESFPALLQSSMKSVVFREVIGLGPERAEEALRECRAWLGAEEMVKTRRGVSPHAPYTVRFSLLDQLATEFPHVPLAMHVAESREELELLQWRTGPFVAFLRSLSAWFPEGIVPSLADLLNELNRFERPILVHGNYLSRADWQNLQPNASIVYCPRTHAFFGHDPYPLWEMLQDGINVALGTDSLASNPDLSVLHEGRFLWQRFQPGLTGEALLNLCTLQGAKALGFAELCGTLTPGKDADFVVLPCGDSNDNPWELLWGSQEEPATVFVEGEEVWPMNR
jgi:cytosine/adenosine deaminase-related metal-dependent hydrolase